MIDFQCLNLIGPWPPLPPMDVIFIRNVLIYFDMDVRRQIAAGMQKALRQDGHLFLGAAESMLGMNDAFIRVQYEKAGCFRLKP